MTPNIIPEGDALTLPRALVEDGRYAEAIEAYERILPRIAASGDNRTLVIGEYELVLVALHTGHLDVAERAQVELHADLDRAGLELSDVEAFMLPLMFQVARGATDGVLEALERFQGEHMGALTLDEQISMLQFGAEVHERRGSPLQTAYLLLAIAELSEEAALEHNQADLHTAVAEAYRDHAIFLARNKAQCVLEAEAGLVDAPDEAGPEAWRAFLALSLDGANEGDDLLAALHRRVLCSLNASDWWGPASHTLRFSVGSCRVQTYLEVGDYEAAVAEARRIAPVGDLAGELEAAHGLRTLTAMLGREIDGPDLGR